MVDKVILGDCTLILGDCLDVMKEIPDKSVDAVITDPPYGINKAEWDKTFPKEWYKVASMAGKTIGIITGTAQLKHTIPLVGNDYIDTLFSRNLNGMTFSPLGYGNCLACVVSGDKPKKGMTFFEFVVGGDMPKHPSPKPIDYMLKLVERITEDGDIILDPFMGSGTTGVACVQTGRKFIGIEIDEKYFEIAVKRIKDAQQQMRLPI